MLVKCTLKILIARYKRSCIHGVKAGVFRCTSILIRTSTVKPQYCLGIAIGGHDQVMPLPVNQQRELIRRRLDINRRLAVVVPEVHAVVVSGPQGDEPDRVRLERRRHDRIGRLGPVAVRGTDPGRNAEIPVFPERQRLQGARINFHHLPGRKSQSPADASVVEPPGTPVIPVVRSPVVGSSPVLVESPPDPGSPLLSNGLRASDPQPPTIKTKTKLAIRMKKPRSPAP